MAAWGAISGMVSAIQAGRFAPCVYLDENGVPADFHAFPLAAFEGAYRAERFGDISSAVEFYYSNKDSSNRMRQKTSDLIKTVNAGINKLQLKKQRLLEDLVKAENADQDRLLGELLTASLHNIKPGQKTAEITNYYDGSTVAIELDPRLSPAQNAQRFYKRYAKAKTAIVEKNNQLAETGRELMYLESVLAFLENASAYEEAEAIRQELIDEGYLRRRKAPASKKPPKPAFLSYQVSGGLQALAGRNNRENDILTFKRASSGDIWFHTKDIPGTHVILLTSGADAPAEAIAEAASIAAWHSRARESENVPVDYTFVKYVKKPSGAKPGMVIFTNNRTIYAKPALPPERM
jgi:predicted ribosome quality control (RQC) complex YloA/Tae2 family protein